VLIPSSRLSYVNTNPCNLGLTVLCDTLCSSRPSVMMTCGIPCRFTSSGRWDGTMEVSLGIGTVCLLKKYLIRNMHCSLIVQWMTIHFRSIQIQASTLTIWTSFDTLAQLSARLYMMAVSSMHILPDSSTNEFWINLSLIMIWLLSTCSSTKAFAGYLLRFIHNAVICLSTNDCQTVREGMVSSKYCNRRQPAVNYEVGIDKINKVNF
jgi:hypothetical protein